MQSNLITSTFVVTHPSLGQYRTGTFSVYINRSAKDNMDVVLWK